MPSLVEGPGLRSLPTTGPKSHRYRSVSLGSWVCRESIPIPPSSRNTPDHITLDLETHLGIATSLGLWVRISDCELLVRPSLSTFPISAL